MATFFKLIFLNRNRWEMPDKNHIGWNYQHYELEKYSRNGKHLGAYDPVNREKIKEPVPGRKIEL